MACGTEHGGRAASRCAASVRTCAVGDGRAHRAKENVRRGPKVLDRLVWTNSELARELLLRTDRCDAHTQPSVGSGRSVLGRHIRSSRTTPQWGAVVVLGPTAPRPRRGLRRGTGEKLFVARRSSTRATFRGDRIDLCGALGRSPQTSPVPSDFLFVLGRQQAALGRRPTPGRRRSSLGRTTAVGCRSTGSCRQRRSRFGSRSRARGRQR